MSKKAHTFSPAMHETWRRAINGSIRLVCGPGSEGRRHGSALRHRLYQLRRALIEENNPLGMSAERVQLLLREEKVEGQLTWVIIGALFGADFEDTLARAGIKGEEAPPLNIPTPTDDELKPTK
jgi:hypothetical protein